MLKSEYFSKILSDHGYLVTLNEMSHCACHFARSSLGLEVVKGSAFDVPIPAELLIVAEKPCSTA